MGSVELALLFKIGIPLAMKLLAAGKTEAEIIKAVRTTIASIEAGDTNIGDALANADSVQAKGIVEGLFGIITGVTDAVGDLVKAFCGLLGSKQT